jgi:inner membrane protein
LDNLAHTLAGAALGHAGLKRKTGMAMGTLMVAANLPDLDVFAMLIGETMAVRRGWTHGPVAFVVLPALWMAAVVAFDRWQARRGTRPADRLPVRPGWLLVLGYAGILSHLLMDLLNTWGIRFLMPFSDRWFYGDALFIIDVWLWGMLAVGVWLSSRRERRGRADAPRPARVALVTAVAYGCAMFALGRAAEAHVREVLRAEGRGAPVRVLASPVPVDPFRRAVVYETPEGYVFGDLRWRPDARLTLAPAPVPTRMDDPAIARAASREKAVADFLTWSRYPFASVQPVPGGTEVVLGDARYTREPGGGPLGMRTIVPDSAGGAKSSGIRGSGQEAGRSTGDVDR